MAKEICEILMVIIILGKASQSVAAVRVRCPAHCKSATIGECNLALQRPCFREISVFLATLISAEKWARSREFDEIDVAEFDDDCNEKEPLSSLPRHARVFNCKKNFRKH
ncbi:hypothetical protein EVAR_45092_1 [Eumeta japonica]|uniref:Secreted protein n=1 Tax=Eumeta variegata TaxID=151549 RepID=A0A4C1YIE7_EUMVA|nr:hypothetical protein EVAR_45092_1 [Eumeta japonica]